MAYTTFSQTKNDQLKEPMFFGQNVNVARYDQQKYETFEKLIEKQLSFFWRPEEVDVNRAKEALERAQERLRQKQSIQEYHTTQAALARALTRLKETEKFLR